MTHHNSPVLTQVIGCKCKLLSCDAPLTHKVQVLTPFLYLTLYSCLDAPPTNQHNQWHHLQYLCIRLWVLVLIIQKASCCFVLKSELWPSTCLRTYLASKIGHCQLTWPNHQWWRFQFGGYRRQEYPQWTWHSRQSLSLLAWASSCSHYSPDDSQHEHSPWYPSLLWGFINAWHYWCYSTGKCPKACKALNVLESACMRIRVTEHKTNKGSLWKEGRQGATKCEQYEE